MPTPSEPRAAAYRDPHSRRTPLESADAAERWCRDLPARYIGIPLTQEPVTLLLEMADTIRVLAANRAYKSGDKVRVQWRGETVTATVSEKLVSRHASRAARNFFRLSIDGVKGRPIYEDSEMTHA